MTDTIPLSSLSHGPFPDGMLQLQMFEVRYLDLVKRCHQQQFPIGVVWIKEGCEVQVPDPLKRLEIVFQAIQGS